MTKQTKYCYFIKDEDDKYEMYSEKEYQEFIKNFHKDHDIDCEPEIEILKVQLVDKRVVEAVYKDIIKEEYDKTRS
jgi:hypothetical protein